MTALNDNPIGIFDSGIGGLTVANAVSTQLSNEAIIYFGDTAHLPYGDKSPETIQTYSEKITRFLLEKNCKTIIVACNTASSFAFNHIKNLFSENIPIINVIDPVVEYILSENKAGKVGVIGTKGTIQANIYAEKIRAANTDIDVCSLATPLFTPMIEEGFINCDISEMVIKKYLSNPILQSIQTLILACTHYPIIKSEIETYYNRQVNVVDSANVVAKYTARILSALKLLNTNHNQNEYRFYVSDYTESFEKTTKRFFKDTIHLEHEKLWDN